VSSLAAACPQCGYPINSGKIGQQTSTSGSTAQSACGWDPRELQQIVAISLIPGKKPWFLNTVNGTGVKMVRLSAGLDTRLSHPGSLAMAAMCVLFVPLIPSGIYLIERLDYQLYRFFGRVPFAACWRGLGPLRSLRLLRSIIAEILLY
jgi:hypothetical protein